MTDADKAFARWQEKHCLYDLPWEVDAKVLHGAFMAGWNAHGEALKQVPLPLGGLDGPSRGVTPEAIYAAYPRKVGKQAALRVIKKLTFHNLTPGWLLDRTTAYAAAVKKWPPEDKKFIPHPATWFNRGSYDDDPKEWDRSAPSQFSKLHP